jgi:hypothetical protein
MCGVRISLKEAGPKRNRDLTVGSSVVFNMSSSQNNSKKSVMKPELWHGKEDTSYINISINIYTYALVSRISQHLLAVPMKVFKGSVSPDF